MESGKLRFGIMCNGNKVALWQFKAIQLLIESNLCECVLIISNNEAKTKKQSLFYKLFSKNSLYHFIFNRFFITTAEKKISISDLAKTISINPIKKGNYSEYFSNEDIQIIKSYQLDFILRFGFGIIRGEILNSAKFGIWSYHHGDELNYRGGPFGFWEIYNREKTTAVVLQKLTEKLDSGYILLKREYKTIFHSWKETRQKLLFNNIDMPLQLTSILQVNADYINKITQAESRAEIYRFPVNHIMLLFLLKLLYNRIKLYIENYLFIEKWMLLLIDRKHDILSDIKNSKTNKKIITTSRTTNFYADGFLIDNETLIFENYSYKKGKAHISIIAGNSNPVMLIQKNNHMAYPYVFNHQDKTYILPEESQSGKLELYEYLKHTHSVTSLGVILNEPAVDAVLYYDGKLFWLFCGIKNNCPNEKLFLYYSESLTGSYTAHAANPVKVTPNGARCAGNIFIYKNKLIRPSQSSVPHYGSKIILQEVTKLNKYTFEEQAIEEINPETINKNYTGTHTISISENKILIDVKKHIFSPFNLIKKKV